MSMERRPAYNVDKALFREIGIACANEGRIDAEYGSASAAGYNQLFRIIIRSHSETNGGETKVWHVLDLTDKDDSLEFYFCKVSEDGQIIYNSNHEKEGPRELNMSQPSDRIILDSLAKQLKSVSWLDENQMNWAESEMERDV